MTLPYPTPRARLSQAQLRGELGRRAVDEAVGERCEKRVAGVRRAEQPLAHRQRLGGRRGDHVAGAGVQEHPAATRVFLSASADVLASTSLVLGKRKTLRRRAFASLLR